MHPTLKSYMNVELPHMASLYLSPALSCLTASGSTAATTASSKTKSSAPTRQTALVASSPHKNKRTEPRSSSAPTCNNNRHHYTLCFLLSQGCLKGVRWLCIHVDTPQAMLQLISIALSSIFTASFFAQQPQPCVGGSGRQAYH